MNWHTKFLWCISLVAIVAMSAFAQNTNLLKFGGFESGKPSMWTTEPGTSGATLTWATDQVHSGTHSLKIVKSTTGATARWVSGNNVRYWVDKIPKGVDIKLGAWVKTSGVNIAPATANDKWQLKFAFYDTNNVIIGAPVALDVDQSVATKGWYADTNAVAAAILPKDAYKYIISAEAGPNATGTVWFDDFIHVSRGSPWDGAQNWNGLVDADSAWVYWIAPYGGNDGTTYFPGSGVTTEQFHSGTSSLKITAAPGRGDGELVWVSETVPVTTGKNYVLSAWVKTSQIKKDSVFNAESQLGFTATWHSKLFADRGGWNEVGGNDFRFTLKDTASGWTQYSVIFTAPATANAVSVRARSWHLWTGNSYWDDFSMNGVLVVQTYVKPEAQSSDGAIPANYALAQNYPNPFNPSTTIHYELPSAAAVTLEVFDIIGQKVATLVNETQSAGKWSVRWDAKNDFGKNVASGIYLYRLSTPNVLLTRKMILLK